MTRRTSRTGLRCALFALLGGLLAVAPATTPAAGHHETGPTGHHETAAAPKLPSGFQDRDAIPNLSEPTGVAFAPDGAAFVALKSGEIKAFDYDAVSREFEPFATHTIFANLHVNVNNYWDRGLTGIAVDPQFGTAGHNYVYVNYTYNRDPRDNPPVVPRWDSGEGTYDGCLAPAAMPDPPDPAVAGCVVSTRVSRIPAVEQSAGWVAAGPEQPLLETGCMQFPSHASGDVRFGPDGWLYASTGDGASFDTQDYGQAGNPCGDPADEGGALRSQDVRTGADALGLGGAVWRINPADGTAPNGSSSNADRLVLYGQRNPWRLTFRPGTSELWSADVGASEWEEINRTDMATFGGPANLGWPCYEGRVGGAVRQPSWDALDKPICENLYALGAGAVQAPAFAYRTRGPLLTPNEKCESTTSSVSGVVFAPTTSNYPSAYEGSLFFSDFARTCIWRLGKKANGDPDPASITPFVQNASTPVQLAVGPDGDLFYVDYGIVDGVVTPQAGGIHRITYQDAAPVAALSANRTYGPLTKTYRFSAAGTKDPNKRALTYAWDLDGNGSFETSTGPRPKVGRRYRAKTNVTVSVRATNSIGRSDTTSLTVYPGDRAPAFTKVTPPRSLTWKVGQRIKFRAKAEDRDQKLRPSAYTWSLAIRHCPKTCHTHPINQWQGARRGSFRAPDHEYPSHLLLDVSVTDNRGLTVHQSVRLDPESVDLTFTTKPAGLRLNVGEAAGKGPLTRTFIVGGHVIATAPVVQRRQGVTYRFRKWSDGGSSSHDVVAPGRARTLTASYRATRALVRIGTSQRGLEIKVDGTKVPRFHEELKVGDKLRLEAPRFQRHKGGRWEFVRWTDDGARAHRVVVGAERLDMKAIYRRVAPAAAPVAAAAAPPPEVPAGFQDVEAIPGLSEPTSVAFAPDGTAFIALKTGLIKTFDYDATTGQFEPWADHLNFANLDVNVENYHDRGLTGIALDPEFGTAGHNFVYVNYAYNRDPRDPGDVPKWGGGGSQYDDCPAPAAMPSGGNPAITGCVVDTRVSRLVAVKQAGRLGDERGRAAPGRPADRADRLHAVRQPRVRRRDRRAGRDALRLSR